MIFQFIIYAIIANGIYDVLSAASILKLTDISILNEYRLSIFSAKQSPVFERVLACYIFINGLIRIFGGMNLYQLALAKIVAGSYFTEALFLYNETYNHNTVSNSKGQFLIGMSMVLGGLSLYNLF